MKVVETKLHLDGRREDFHCDSLLWTPRHAVVQFIWERAESLEDGPIHLPAGVIKTTAAFWQERTYLIYKIMRGDGTLIGHRFDVCMDVQINTNSLTWLDLLVDLWVDPTGTIHVLDEADVAQYQARGLLSPQQHEIISSTASFLLTHHQSVIAEAGL